MNLEKWAREERPWYTLQLIPKISSYTRSFWEAVRQHEFVIQQCKNCGNKIYPPQPVCPECLSEDFEWIKSSGKGKVLTYTTIYEFPPSWCREITPYTIVLVKLDGGIVVMSHLIDCEPEDVKCEMEVEVVFEDLTEDFSLLKFKPASR